MKMTSMLYEYTNMMLLVKDFIKYGLPFVIAVSYPRPFVIYKYHIDILDRFSIYWWKCELQVDYTCDIQYHQPL